MEIIIAGCGKIGMEAAANLTLEGHSVTVIDKNPNVLNNIINIYDVMSVCGNAVNYEILSEAGIKNADMFIAVMGSDELNMLSCFAAKNLGVKSTIARIRNPEYNDKSLGFMRQHLGLSMAINPELLAAKEIFNILKLPAAVKTEHFSRRNFEIAELKVTKDSALCGLKLIDMREKFNFSYLVCAIQRGSEVFIPNGNFTIECGDKIGITASAAEIQKLLKSLNYLKKQARNIMILGGSKTAVYLAKMLVNTGNSVKIIDNDPVRCAELSKYLEKVVIINGDGSSRELLLEEGLKDIDAFISLTGIDEENILISLYASMQNVSKVVAKVNRNELISMADNLGLDSIISQKDITTNILVGYARALENSFGSNVETLYKVMDGKVEALEFNIRPDSKLIGIPLKDLSLKKDTLIAGIMRGRKTIIPNGDDIICPNDKVIVFAANQRLRDLSDILFK